MGSATLPLEQLPTAQDAQSRRFMAFLVIPASIINCLRHGCFYFSPIRKSIMLHACP